MGGVIVRTVVDGCCTTRLEIYPFRIRFSEARLKTERPRYCTGCAHFLSSSLSMSYIHNDGDSVSRSHSRPRPGPQHNGSALPHTSAPAVTLENACSCRQLSYASPTPIIFSRPILLCHLRNTFSQPTSTSASSLSRYMKQTLATCCPKQSAAARPSCRLRHWTTTEREPYICLNKLAFFLLNQLHICAAPKSYCEAIDSFSGSI